MKNRRKLFNSLYLLLFYLVLVMMSCFILLPFVWLFLSSFKTSGEMFSIPPTWFPNAPTLKHYIDVLSQESFRSYFKNSVVVTVISTTISLAIGSLSAYGFARFKFKFNRVLLAFIIVIRMLPPITLAIPFFMLMRSIGLLNTKTALIITYLPIQLPLIIWVLEGFFRELPREIEEAAEIDGLGPLGIFYKIAIPLSMPAIGAASLLAFLEGWREFIFALSLTRDLSAQTVPVGIAGKVTAFQTMWGQMNASAVLYLIPVLIFTVISQKTLVKGISTGALKE